MGPALQGVIPIVHTTYDYYEPLKKNDSRTSRGDGDEDHMLAGRTGVEPGCRLTRPVDEGNGADPRRRAAASPRRQARAGGDGHGDVAASESRRERRGGRFGRGPGPPAHGHRPPAPRGAGRPRAPCRGEHRLRVERTV